MDLVFVVDNSSSMGNIISQVQSRLSVDLPAIVGAAGFDFRVILISRYGDIGVPVGGSDNPICVGSPLGVSDCSSANSVPLENNPPRFFHYSADVESTTPLCVLLDSWNTPDEIPPLQRPWDPLLPNGWSSVSRAAAFKRIVVVSDGHANCRWKNYDFTASTAPETIAKQFDRAIRELSPEHFGTEEQRQYAVHSVVGLAPSSPPHVPWQPDAPLQRRVCGGAAPGLAYQAISRLPGGLRYPTCLVDNYDPIFQALAERIETARQCPD